jgi:hypothetical protein
MVMGESSTKNFANGGFPVTEARQGLQASLSKIKLRCCDLQESYSPKFWKF